MTIDKLTQSEADTPLWIKLEDHFRGKIQELREANDDDRNEIDTSRLRGRIEAYKDMLELRPKEND